MRTLSSSRLFFWAGWLKEGSKLLIITIVFKPVIPFTFHSAQFLHPTKKLKRQLITCQCYVLRCFSPFKLPFKKKTSHFVVHFSPKDPSCDPTDVAAPCLAMPRAPRAPERPTRPEEPQEMEPGAVGRKRKATKVKQSENYTPDV